MRRFSVVFAAAVSALAWIVSCADDGPCRYNSDCTRAYCDNGQCKRDCVDSAIDCKPGFRCNAVAQCEAITGDGGVIPGLDAAADTVVPTPDASPDVTVIPDAPVESGGTKRELDVCTSNGDCGGALLCRPFVKGAGLQRCVRACTQSGQCPSGTACVTSGSEQYCAWADVGRACSAAATCQFACLTGPGYCTLPCANGSECPNGYGCMPVSNTRVCVKLEAECDVSQTQKCIVSSACDTTRLVSGCTIACANAADCPRRAAGLAAWTCDSGGICRRPSDVYGPVGNGQPAEYACNATNQVVNICNDAQHIDFDQFTVPGPPSVNCSAPQTTMGTLGDVCVDSCRYQGGCPFGYACSAVGSVASSRIGLCLPALGSNEVGMTCAKDGDCSFGYCNRTTSKCSRDCTSDGLCPTGSSCTVVTGSPAVEGAAFRRCE